MRVVIADDEALFRDGLGRLLEDAGVEVPARVGSAEELIRRVAAIRPDVAIIDIRMPPTHTDEGLLAAQQILREQPQVGVLVLSHYLESHWAMRLLEDHPERCGYLLKDRVSDVAVLVDALGRISEGECVVDPTIVARLVKRPREESPLQELSPRELEVLALIAEGHSNEGICRKLFLSPKTVETHVRHILLKLGIGEAAEYSPPRARRARLPARLRGSRLPGSPSRSSQSSAAGALVGVVADEESSGRTAPASCRPRCRRRGRDARAGLDGVADDQAVRSVRTAGSSGRRSVKFEMPPPRATPNAPSP